jgi:hypothetical protein
MTTDFWRPLGPPETGPSRGCVRNPTVRRSSPLGRIATLGVEESREEHQDGERPLQEAMRSTKYDRGNRASGLPDTTRIERSTNRHRSFQDTLSYELLQRFAVQLLSNCAAADQHSPCAHGPPRFTGQRPASPGRAGSG